MSTPKDRSHHGSDAIKIDILALIMLHMEVLSHVTDVMYVNVNVIKPQWKCRCMYMHMYSLVFVFNIVISSELHAPHGQE